MRDKNIICFGAYIIYMHRETRTWSSSSAEGLPAGSLVRQHATKSLNSLDHFSGSVRRGGGLLGIMNMAWQVSIFFVSNRGEMRTAVVALPS